MEKQMSRAVILPFPGDPFLLNYWMMHFERYWENEVSTLYVYHNSTMPADVVNYIKNRVERHPKGVLLYSPAQIDHGDVIDRTLDFVWEKYVMLAEDDGFIFKPGVINRCFEALESGSYDLVGSKRGSCSTEIAKAASKKWGITYDGEGDQGCNFWPCFLFAKADTLRNTDRNFKAKHWYKGEYIEALDHTLENDATGDTFVNTSLQLHATIPGDRILYVPQYHGHPDDFDHYTKQKYLWDGKAPWCHIGSLSSGVGGILKDGHNRTLTRYWIDEPNGTTTLQNAPTNDFERREYERRVQWWLSAWEVREAGELEKFAELYRVAINQVIAQFKLSPKRIAKRQRMYRELGIL